MPEGVLHHSKLLTNVSNQYLNDAYIAEQLFPKISVQKETDRIAVHGVESFVQSESLRANGSPARETTHSYSYTSYYLTSRALKEVVTDRDRQNMDAPLNADVDAVTNVTEKLKLDVEVDAMKACFTTTSFAQTTALASTTSWRYNTTSSNDPILNVASGTSIIVSRTGRMPNKMVFGYNTFNSLKNSVFVLDRIKYSQAGVITPAILASLFDMDTLLVGHSAYNTSAEGVFTTTSWAQVWSNGCLFFYAPAAGSLRTPSAGYMLTRGQLFRTKKWRDEEVEGDWVEVNAEYAFKAVGTSAGFYISGTDV